MGKKYINGCLAAMVLLGSLALPIGNAPMAYASEATGSDLSFEQDHYGALVASGYVENPSLGSTTVPANPSYGYEAGTYYKYAKSIEATATIPEPNSIGASEYYVVMEAAISTYGFGGNGVTDYTRNVTGSADNGVSYSTIWEDRVQAIGAGNYSLGTLYQVVKVNGGPAYGVADAQGKQIHRGEYNLSKLNKLKIYFAYGSGYYESMKSLKYRVYRKDVQPTSAPIVKVSPSENFHTGNNNSFTIAKPEYFANYQEQYYGILQYRLNGGAWINYTDETSVPVSDEGVVKIESRLLTRDTLESPYGVAYSRQDNSPPSPPNFDSLDSTKWYRSAYDLLINAGQDDQSGVDAIYYSLEGAMNQPKSPFWMLGQSVTPKRIFADGVTTVKATNRNRAGLESSEVVGTIRIDTKPPTASFTTTEGWATAATIHAVGTDATSGMQSITLPNGQVVNGSSADYRVTANGTYTFTLTDVAGNAVTKSYDVSNIDDVIPTVALSKNGATWTDQEVSTTFKFDDAKSGINIYKMYYQWTNSTDTPTSWRQATRTQETVTIKQEGTWYLHLRAYDLADNVVEFTSEPFQLQQLPIVPKLSVVGTATDKMLLSWSLPSGSVNTDGLKYQIRNETTGRSWTVDYPVNQLLDDSLAGGTNYSYTITATNHIGSSAASDGVVGVTLPQAPVNVSVYPNEDNFRSALVNIDPVPSATAYRIKATNWSTQSIDRDTTVTSSTYQTISRLRPYTMYDIAVSAINASGEGPAHHTSFLTLPNQPNGFSAVQIGEHTIDLTWNSVTRAVYDWSSVTDDTYYRLRRDNQIIYTGAFPSYEDTGLESGTAYDYDTQAGNSTGWGSKSTLSQIWTLPSAPRSLRQTQATTSSFTVQLEPPKGTTGFQAKVDGQIGANLGSVLSQYTFTGYKPGTTHLLEIAPYNRSGVGKSTSIIVTTLPDQPAEGAIKVSDIQSDRVTFNVYELSGATKYKISINNKDYEVAAGETTISGLQSGVEYAYSVTAGNAAGYGAAYTSQILTLPAAPADYEVSERTPTSVVFKWSAVKSATSYEVSDNAGKLIAIVQTPEYKMSGLLPGSTTRINVRAVNASGTGAASAFGFRTLPGFSDDLIDYSKLVHVDDVGLHDAHLSWLAVPGADQYAVYDAHQQLIAQTTERNTVIEQLSSATSHDGYTVIPVNDSGEGKAMPVPSWETLPDGQMTITHESTRNSITLHLQHQLAAETLVIAEGGKELYRGKAEGYTEFVQSELSPDSLYTFKIWTENAEGQASKAQELKIFTRKERIVQQNVPTTPEIQPIIDEPVQPEQTTAPSNEPSNKDDKKKGFVDIDRSFAKASITRLADMGIVQGISDDLYAPQNGTTRAEFMALLTRLALTPEQIKQAGDESLSFTDVNSEGWYIPELRAAIQHGIAKGFSADRFAPDEAIDREQAAKMLANALQNTVSVADTFYTDADAVSPWAQNDVNGLTAKRILEGYPDQTFRPHATLTRAESAAMIDRALQHDLIQVKK